MACEVFLSRTRIGRSQPEVRKHQRHSHPESLSHSEAGSGVGCWSKHRAVRREDSRNTIISFEPLPLVHARWIETATKDPRWIVAPRGALGSEREDVELNIVSNTVSSSLLLR
jgi:hypothetical protein